MVTIPVSVRQLWRVGVTEIYIDGSFVEDKDHPNDIDGYFLCERSRITSGDLVRELNLLDPNKVWTWDWNRRSTFRKYPKPQSCGVFMAELFHYGQLWTSTVCPRVGVSAAFRKSRYSHQTAWSPRLEPSHDPNGERISRCGKAAS